MSGRHQRLFEKRWSALIKDAGRSTFPLSASCSHIRSFFIWKKTLVLIIKKTKYMWTRTLRASTVASIGTDWLVCLGFIRDADNDTHTRNISQHSFSLKKEGEQINEREQIMCRYLHTMMAEMTACWQRCHSGGLCGALGSYLKLCSCQSRPDGPPRTSRPGSEASHTKWKPATCLWFRFNRLPGWTLSLSLCVVIGLK